MLAASVKPPFERRPLDINARMQSISDFDEVTPCANEIGNYVLKRDALRFATDNQCVVSADCKACLVPSGFVKSVFPIVRPSLRVFWSHEKVVTLSAALQELRFG